MLETIREYAVERLEARARRARSTGGMEWFLALAQEANPHLRQESAAWVDRLEREHDNVTPVSISSSVRASTSSPSPGRIRGGSGRSFSSRGRAAASRDRPRRQHALDGQSRLRACGSWRHRSDMGDDVTPRPRLEEASPALARLGDRWASPTLWTSASRTHSTTSSHARNRSSRRARLFGELGDEHWTLRALRPPCLEP